MSVVLTVPALAITESEVEAQISASSRESVTGNVLIWFLCAVGFLKVSQKIDSFLASMGVTVGHTGGSMMAEAMIAMKSVTMMAGAAGKAVGGFARKGGGTSGSPGSSGAPGATGASWPLKGGLAGVVSRKMSRDAVKTATTQTKAATSHASKTASASHTATATAAHTSSAAQRERSTSQQTATFRQTAASQQTVKGRQTATQQHTATASQTSSSRQASTQRQSQSKTAMFSKAVSRISSVRPTSLGGAMFTRSLLSGGQFAHEVIGKVASGDIRSTGSISGDLAAQALLAYTGITALGDQATEKPVYSGVEIGGGRITGTETTSDHPRGIAFGMYHAGQYAKPDGAFQPVHTADGQLWYKQYAVDTVVKTPFKAPDGEVDYHKDIVKKLPDPPKRKDRM